MFSQVFESNGWYLVFFALCSFGGYKLHRLKRGTVKKKAARKDSRDSDIEKGRLDDLIRAIEAGKEVLPDDGKKEGDVPH